VDNAVQQTEEFTVPEAAAYLKVTEETVRRHIRAKRLPAEKKGIQWFIGVDDLRAFGSAYDPTTGKRRRLI